MSGRPSPEGRVERLFLALFRAYPASFRTAYETDALELFRDRLRDARGRGLASVARLLLTTYPDLVVQGLLERFASMGRSLRREGGGGTWRAAARGLARQSGLSTVVVVTLGLGIGANVALFGVLKSVVLEPLPYPDADRLVRLWETNPEVDSELHGPSPWNVVDWQREARAFESMTAWYVTSATYRTDAWIEEVRSAQVTPAFFETLGVRPAVGRAFSPGEVTGHGPVVLSHGFWQRRFGGDPDVVGRTVVASGASYEIIGVMPPDFTFPDASVETWIGWDIPTVYAGNTDARTWRFLGAVGRLALGQSVEAGEEDLDRVAAGLAEAYPEMNAGWDVEVESLHEATVGDVGATLWIAFGAVLFILLIACANVANLLLARVPARARDVSIRVTLGATRGRIAAELFAENALLGAASGLLGLGLGRLFIELLVALDAGRIPRLAEVSVDPGVFVFTAAVAGVTALTFGAAPLVQLLRSSASGASAHARRTTGTAGQHGVREIFVGSQVAIALVLLAGAGLFAASLRGIGRVDPGIDPTGVAAFRVSLDPVGGTQGETATYYRTLLARIAEVPGVIAVGAAQTLPMNPVSNDFRRPYRPLGSELQAADAPAVQMRIVTPGYIDAMGMTLLDGTAIPPEAAAGEPLVAVINRTLAGRLWPGASPVGETFEIDFRQGWQPYRVVGVVGDVRHYGPRQDALPEVFLAHAQVPYLAMNVVARSRTRAPEALFADLEATVLSHRPVQPPHDFTSMDALVAATTAEERFLSVLLGLFAGVGLLLAGTGVYGVIAYSVSHRRREIGVRMALGAPPGRVVGAVLRRALVVAVGGMAVGAAGVFAVGGLIDDLLFGVTPRDPTTVLGTAAVLLAVAAVAAWIPARRAASIAPSEALQAE